MNVSVTFFPFLGISKIELARASAEVAHFLGHSAEIAQCHNRNWGLPPPSLQLKTRDSGRWNGKAGEEGESMLVLRFLFCSL